MKKTLALLFITYYLILTPSAFAAKPTTNPTREAERQVRAQVKTEEKIKLRVTKANAEIDRRIKAMNQLIARINALKKLTVLQKEALMKQIQTEINDLTALKDKINAETDPKELLKEKNSIISSYRIFALFSPKINIIAHADRIINLGETMKTKTTASEALAKIDESQKTASEAIDLVMKLEPTGWPANKVQLTQARDLLKDARKDLVDAWQIAKDEKKGSPAPTSSVTPTPSPSVD